MSKKRNAKKTKGTEVSQALEERKHLLSTKSDFFIREAYKTMRTNVTFSLTEEKDCNVLIVTSSLQSEGKSITAMNLAISYVQTDKKVVIIDCDLRKPKLARLLGHSSKIGLSNLLLQPKLLDQAIIHHELGVDAILSGDIPPNPSELLGSERMSKLLEELKTRYDMIILDTPPVNMVTDAVVLAPKTDGILFVVRANQSERGAVMHAVEQLEYAKAKVLGFVLNGVDMDKTSYGYGKYKRYGRYRRYGYGRYGYSRYGYSRRGYGYGYGYSSSEAAPSDGEQRD